MARISLLVGLGLSVCLAAACDAPSYPAFDRGELLSEATETLILPGYRSAADSAASLHAATTALCASPSATTLSAAQQAWLTAASDWRATSPFLVRSSPTVVATTVTVAQTDSNLTSAASISTIEAHIAGTEDLGAARFVPSLGAQDKGFFTLEYFLFGYPSFTTRDDTMTLAALADTRRCTYATAVAADIDTNIAGSRDAWIAFAPDFETGSGDSYSSTQSAASELISAVAAAIDTTQDVHIGRPLGLTNHAGNVESPYAGASVTLMDAALESADHTWSMTPHCLDAFLRSRNAMLADDMLSEIASSRAAVAALQSPPLAMPWESYVDGSDHAAGQTAYHQLTTLKSLLLADVASTLGVTVFLPSDGD